MLVSVAQAQLFFLALTRILAVIIHVPVLGGNTIPTNVRVGLGVILTAVLIHWQPLPSSAQALGLLPLAFALLKEIIIGTIAGFSANLTFGALQIAGETMSSSAGFSAARTLNPLIGEQSTAMDQLFTMMSFLLFLIINGHHTFIIALQRTFTLIPVNSPMPDFPSDRIYVLVGQLIITGIQLALPVMATLLMTDFTMGLLSRVAPQIQVFFLGLPLKVGLGLIVFGLTVTMILPILSDKLRDISVNMLWLLGG